MAQTSINILNYNTYEKSCVCIDSCFQQKGVDFRIMLIDNNSTDDSFLRLKQKYGDKIDYFETGYNYGFAGGNNKGVDEALKRGFKYSLLLNSDTELKGNSILQRMITIMQRYPKCAVVSPTIYDVTHSGLILHNNDSSYLKSLRLLGVLPSLEMLTDSLQTVSEAHGSALFVDLEKFQSVDGFPEYYFMYTEECTFCKKTIWAGYQIIWFKDDTAYILHHHDKNGVVDAWRVILMGRNRALEYYENRKGRLSWFFAYNLLYAKLLLRSFRDRYSKDYIHGLNIGRGLYKMKISKVDLFKNGLNIYNERKKKHE